MISLFIKMCNYFTYGRVFGMLTN